MPPLATSIYELLIDVPAYLSLAAILTFCLLLVLYFSQRRDLHRLLAWMEQEPGHPAADLAASEALLDRAETELEEVVGTSDGTSEPVVEPTLVAPPPSPATQTAVQPAHERPALERITMERAALLPHQRWRRTVRRVSQPRVLGLIALGAVVLGLAAIFGSGRLLNEGGGKHKAPNAQAINPADVTVAVLNGTSVPGLAAKVGSDVKVNGFKLGVEGNTRRSFGQTVVMYEPHQQRAANKVAHALGVKPVQPIDRQTQAVANGADVAVIAGADRAKP